MMVGKVCLFGVIELFEMIIVSIMLDKVKVFGC